MCLCVCGVFVVSGIMGSVCCYHWKAMLEMNCFIGHVCRLLYVWCVSAHMLSCMCVCVRLKE